jgi:hypothetical protein
VNNGNSTVTLDARAEHELIVPLYENWNMMSINIIPVPEFWDDNEEYIDVELMCAQFGEGENSIMDIMKNAAGDFCKPSWGYWGIESWNLEEGYLMKMTDDVEAMWTGAPIHPQTEIPVVAGWNMIPYYPQYDLDASEDEYYVIPRDIIESLIIAKDEGGRFLSPVYGFSTMIPWTEGEGYQVNVTEDMGWVYPDPQDRGAVAATKPEKFERHWGNPVITGANMSVLINSISGVEVNDGDQIAAYSTDGVLVGVGTVKDGRCGLAVWGDDEYTKDVTDGLMQRKLSSFVSGQPPMTSRPG